MVLTKVGGRLHQNISVCGVEGKPVELKTRPYWEDQHCDGNALWPCEVLRSGSPQQMVWALKRIVKLFIKMIVSHQGPREMLE